MTQSVNVQLSDKVKQRLESFGRQRSLSLEDAARTVIEEHLALEWQAQAAQQTWAEFQAGSEEATWAELVGRGRWVVAESRARYGSESLPGSSRTTKSNSGGSAKPAGSKIRTASKRRSRH